MCLSVATFSVLRSNFLLDYIVSEKKTWNPKKHFCRHEKTCLNTFRMKFRRSWRRIITWRKKNIINNQIHRKKFSNCWLDRVPNAYERPPGPGPPGACRSGACLPDLFFIDRASLYSSTHSIQFTKKRCLQFTKCKQTAEKSQKDNEMMCVQPAAVQLLCKQQFLRPLDFSRSKIEISMKRCRRKSS